MSLHVENRCRRHVDDAGGGDNAGREEEILSKLGFQLKP